jgi:hypothetical protein
MMEERKMIESVSMETLKKFIQIKLGNDVKLIKVTDSQIDFNVIVDAGVEFASLNYDVENGLEAIDTNGNNQSSAVHCLLFNEDLVGGRLLLEGAKNDVLVVDGELPDTKDIELLIFLEIAGNRT